jgi:hypothetical protein
MVKNMMEIFMPNLWILTPTMWLCFASYTTWYVTKAKHYSAITDTEANQLWTIHKRNMNCNGRKWRQIKHRGKIVGFQCECGYKHIQHRPIVAHTSVAPTNSQTSAFDKLHTTHKST